MVRARCAAGARGCLNSKSVAIHLGSRASQSDLVAAYTDTRVLYADGEDDLGELIAGVDQERFESASDLYIALQNVIPVAAVGEPGQSDGDA